MSRNTTPHRAGVVTLAGRANVGKSTLLNRLVGEKVSIVSDVPQTTRHRILGVVTLPGAQIAFLDTPGIHKPQHRMNRLMVSAALDAVRDVDLVLWLVDASEGIGPGDRYIGRILRGEGMPPCVLVLNKADRIAKPRLLPLIGQADALFSPAEIVPVSALTGDNCDRLQSVVLARLPEAPPLYPADTLTDQTERRLVAELVRERVLESTRQEIPHETAVTVDRWEEGEGGLVDISATIHCERESQKAILIGRGGAVMKQVGTGARAGIEQLLDRRVMLRLWVRVTREWRENERLLHEMGIGGD